MVSSRAKYFITFDFYRLLDLECFELFVLVAT